MSSGRSSFKFTSVSKRTFRNRETNVKPQAQEDWSRIFGFSKF
jgi:uncharacterized protein (DUF2384 family)